MFRTIECSRDSEAKSRGRLTRHEFQSRLTKEGSDRPHNHRGHIRWTVVTMVVQVVVGQAKKEVDDECS